MSISPKFVLRNAKSDSLTSIKFYFDLKNERFVYSLGKDKRIIPQLWDKDRMRPISAKVKDYPNKKQRDHNKYLISKWSKINSNLSNDLLNLNTRIENIVITTYQYFNELSLNGEKYNKANLKERLYKTFDIDRIQKKEKDKLNLNQYIEQFIKELKSGVRTYTNSRNESIRYAHSTIKSYDEWKTQFDLFQKSTRKKLDFEDITIDTHTKYVQYFNKKNYTPNTIGRHIKSLKVIMNAAFDEGLHKNTEYQRKKFKTLKSEVKEIYLNHDEIESIRKLDLSKKPKYDLARDVFLCGCYTALRYSDYSRIKENHIVDIDGVRCIQITARKTKKEVFIPIRPELEEILSKYDYNLPKTYEQKVNENIKEVCKLAKIKELISVKKIKGGLEVVTKKPKHDLVKTHTARRSGATLMYNSGMKPIDIMKITQHTTERNLLRYIKVGAKETAVRLAKSDFFIGNPLKAVK